MVKAKSLGSVQSPRSKSFLALVAVASVMVSLSAQRAWCDLVNDLGTVTPIVEQQYGSNGAGSNGKGSSNNHNSNENHNGNGNGNGNGSKKDNANKTNKICSNSEKIGHQYECDSTYDFIDKAQLTNMVSETAGGLAVSAGGQVGMIRAQSAGTQSAVMQADANNREKAGMLQTGLGMINAGVGIRQIQLGNQHKQNGRTIEGLQKDAAASTSPADQTKNYDEAIGEQTKAQKTSMNAGILSTLKGAQQLVAGALSIAAAKQSKDMAEKLQDVSGQSFQMPTGNPNPLTDSSAGLPPLNPGAQQDPAITTDNSTYSSDGVPNIAPPINPDAGGGGVGSGPVAGDFRSGNAPSAGGGGSGGGIGVGSMSPAKADSEPSGPRMADNKSNTAYQGGGAGYAAGGSGVSAEKSADLGFLANLLPKPQEEMGKNGILDYGTAGRSPASMAPYSFLGKDVNIFQRVSDRTTAKFKNGDVGG